MQYTTKTHKNELLDSFLKNTWVVVYSWYSCSYCTKPVHNSVSFSLVKRLNWHIKSSAGNCSDAYGKDDLSFTFKMRSFELTVASQEKDFGTTIENSTKTSA